MIRLVLLATLPLALSACDGGEVVKGQVVAPVTPRPDAAADRPAGARAYALTGFNTIQSTGPDRVVVTVGPAFAARAEGPEAVLDDLVLSVADGTLTIGRERRFEGPTAPATVRIARPALTAASLRGSGGIAIDRMAGDALAATVAGSGDLTIGRVEAGVLTLSLGGSGAMRAAGTARRLAVASAGSGDVEAAGLIAAAATVSVQGSGDVTATVNGPADVDVVGSGNVTLGGAARCTTAVAGSGTVRCGR